VLRRGHVTAHTSAVFPRQGAAALLCELRVGLSDCYRSRMAITASNPQSVPTPEIVLVHSSDIHVDVRRQRGAA